MALDGNLPRDGKKFFKTQQNHQTTFCIASATLSYNPNRLQAEPSSLPPLDVEDDNMLSIAPSIVRENSETCPPVDDAVSLYGEKDLDDNNDNQDPNESDATAQDVFLDKIDMATAISAPKGPPIADHLAQILNDKFKKY